MIRIAIRALILWALRDDLSRICNPSRSEFRDMLRDDELRRG